MNQFEFKEQNSLDPSINRCVRLEIWVVEHSLDVFGVHFDMENLDSNDVEAVGSKCAE